MIKISVPIAATIGVIIVFVIHRTDSKMEPYFSVVDLAESPATQLNTTNEKLTIRKFQVTILYETYCPESERFMVQLGPVYEALKDYLQIEFVPFGSTKLYCQNQIHGKCLGPFFTCQHGPKSCHANRLHDCALQYSEGQEQQMNFIMCTMGAYKTTAEKCLNLLGYSIYDIDTCLTFDEGTELQLKSHAKTKLYETNMLPVVIIDRKYSSETHLAALRDFRIFACYAIRNRFELMLEVPDLCKIPEIFPEIIV